MKLIKILLFLFIINTFILIGYSIKTLTSNAIIEFEKVNVSRVIDGDTLSLEDTRKVRLLGINTPEKSQLYYEDAKTFLQVLEGREVLLDARDTDKYQRTLGYIYYQNKLVNEEILKQGLGNLYVYDEDENTNKLEKAEQTARQHKLKIWKPSPKEGCIILVELNYNDEEGSENQEQLILFNNCEKISGTLKDSATHIYNIDINSGTFIKNFSHIWNNEGDSLYLYDKEGLLLFYRY